MATATSSFASYDHSVASSSAIFRMSNNPTFSKQNHDFFTANTSSFLPRHGHYLDDMDILSLKRQYAHIDLFNQSMMSNSADDLSQLDRQPYQCDLFGPDENDIDEYDLPYDDTSAYEYSIMIQERLKKANEELAHDDTPVELKHSQRVSFDTVVKAVDIVQDPMEYENDDALIRKPIESVAEEPSNSINSPRSETSAHEYTVPLNDTQPKEGLTLLQQLKALQFHNTLPTDDRWATTTTNNGNNDSVLTRDDLSVSSCKSNENNGDIPDASNSLSSKKAMVVAVNGRFDLQDEDDYIAQQQLQSSTNSHNDDSTSTMNNKAVYLPSPPKQPKQKQAGPQRPFLVRPKSSDSGKRTDNNSVKLSSEKKNKSDTNNRQRPKSAGVPKSAETSIDKPSSGVDFDELLRKAKEKKRAELREANRKNKEAEEKRQQELAKAKECYERWLKEKEAGLKKIKDEKQLEKQEHEARQAEEEKELAELREKKFKEWLQRKERQTQLENEFKKLKADENGMTSGESSSSINTGTRSSDHRAFQKWLRRKYKQSMEAKRQLRLAAEYQRHRRRRSIKRYQLQQDLQLAKSFGYS